MRDALVIAGVIAFFVLGAAYIALCARILADTGDIDEPNADETDETDETRASPFARRPHVRAAAGRPTEAKVRPAPTGDPLRRRGAGRG